MELTNSIISEVCEATNFRYNGEYFIYNIFYNLGASSIDLQIKSEICEINDNSSLWAKVFVDGYNSSWQKRFENLYEYISYLTNKRVALNYKIKNDLDYFLNNLFDDNIFPRD